MEYSTWALLLVAIGAVLLIAEVFIPSGGVIAVLSAASLVMAIYCAYHAWYAESPGYFYLFLGGMVTLLPIGVGAAFYVWPSTPFGKRALLEGPTPDEVVPFQELEERFSGMLGKTGETVTLLNPAGIVRIDGQRVHCQSEGTIIEAGVPVKVISVAARRVIVRPYVPLPDTATTPPAAQERDPLDFDIG
jgi:membrane-bound ClpP family serine protease